MIELLKDLLPKEALLGVAFGGVVSYALGGVVADRIAERDHVPACIRGSVGAAEVSGPRGPSDADIALDVTRRLAEALPGPWAGLIDTTRRAAEAHREAQERAAAQLVAAKAPDRCRCRKALALEQTRLDWALYVASLKLWRTEAVERFSGVMAAADRLGVCTRS